MKEEYYFVSELFLIKNAATHGMKRTSNAANGDYFVAALGGIPSWCRNGLMARLISNSIISILL